MNTRFAVACVVCLGAGRVYAQADAPTSTTAVTQDIASAPAVPSTAGVDAPPTTSESVPGTQPAPAEEELDETASEDSALSSMLAKIQIHGFVSEGGFISTDNDYIGKSERGSLKLFEAGLNISAQLTDELRVGLQLVSRSVGALSEEVPRLDWAVIDYRYRPYLGLRAGVIKMPYGLYNEYISIDASRTAVLLPQSMYPLRNRDALVSYTGFGLYGTIPLSVAGSLDYQVMLGTLAIPRSALELSGAELNSVDTKYVTGGQLFWSPPVDGLRAGVSYVRASVNFNLTLDSGVTRELIDAGIVGSDYQGKLVISQRPAEFWVASVEYTHEDLLLAAEYGRWLKHQVSDVPMLVPLLEEDAERFYAMATYRFTPYFELGTYYSVTHADVDDRRGHSDKLSKRAFAFQRDWAMTLRFDVNPYWLWKLEGHLMDGAADLLQSVNANPTRHWGLFLLRTTVTF